MPWASTKFAQVVRSIPSVARLFDKATVNLKDGKKFTVVATDNSRTNKYVQKMLLNGEELVRPFFTHQDITDGGTLELIMGDKPVKTNN